MKVAPKLEMKLVVKQNLEISTRHYKFDELFLMNYEGEHKIREPRLTKIGID
jgi:hypothetical protein